MSEMQEPHAFLLHQVEAAVAVPCSRSDASGQGGRLRSLVADDDLAISGRFGRWHPWRQRPRY